MAAEIVLGYDGTDGAKAALGEATRLAQELGAELIVAFATRTPPLGGEVKDLHKAIVERAQTVTTEAVADARAAGADARAELVHEDPAPALVDLAAQLGARMIVVGSYGEGPLKGALLGSTPHKLIQLSPVPVLVVRG
jgi:nucleotide-binding universal stress UspA family protein